MVFRFRNTKIGPHVDHSPSFLFNGIDPSNRSRLLRYFDLDDSHDVINFFVWIRSSFGKYEIDGIAKETVTNVLYEDFIKMNEIRFFLSLPLIAQQHIINKYTTYIEKFKF